MKDMVGPISPTEVSLRVESDKQNKRLMRTGNGEQLLGYMRNARGSIIATGGVKEGEENSLTRESKKRAIRRMSPCLGQSSGLSVRRILFSF